MQLVIAGLWVKYAQQVCRNPAREQYYRRMLEMRLATWEL